MIGVVLALILIAYLGIKYLAIYPNAYENIGVLATFPNNGNTISIHLEKSESAETWNFWDSFTFTWGNAITTGIDDRKCAEMGLYRNYQGGCGIDNAMADGNIISRSATLDGIPVDVRLSRFNVEAYNFPSVYNPSTLIIDLVVEIECSLGEERCSGTDLQICESVNQHFDWYEDHWDANVNRYIDKGEVIGKCGAVECNYDSECNSGYVCISNSCEEEQIIPDPTPPQIPFWSKIKNSIINFLKSIFNLFFTISGNVEVTPGTQETYTISLVNPTNIDSDFSDGTMAWRKGSMALIDKNENIIQENVWKDVENSYSDSITITVPDNLNNNAIIGVIVESNATYNVETKSWEYSDWYVIAKEGVNIKTKIPTPQEPDVPVWARFINFLKNIWSILINLFK